MTNNYIDEDAAFIDGTKLKLMQIDILLFGRPTQNGIAKLIWRNRKEVYDELNGDLSENIVCDAGYSSKSNYGIIIDVFNRPPLMPYGILKNRKEGINKILMTY